MHKSVPDVSFRLTSRMARSMDIVPARAVTYKEMCPLSVSISHAVAVLDMTKLSGVTGTALTCLVIKKLCCRQRV